MQDSLENTTPNLNAQSRYWAQYRDLRTQIATQELQLHTLQQNINLCKGNREVLKNALHRPELLEDVAVQYGKTLVYYGGEIAILGVSAVAYAVASGAVPGVAAAVSHTVGAMPTMLAAGTVRGLHLAYDHPGASVLTLAAMGGVVLTAAYQPYVLDIIGEFGTGLNAALGGGLSLAGKTLPYVPEFFLAYAITMTDYASLLDGAISKALGAALGGKSAIIHAGKTAGSYMTQNKFMVAAVGTGALIYYADVPLTLYATNLLHMFDLPVMALVLGLKTAGDYLPYLTVGAGFIGLYHYGPASLLYGVVHAAAHGALYAAMTVQAHPIMAVGATLAAGAYMMPSRTEILVKTVHENLELSLFAIAIPFVYKEMMCGKGKMFDHILLPLATVGAAMAVSHYVMPAVSEFFAGVETFYRTAVSEVGFVHRITARVLDPEDDAGVHRPLLHPRKEAGIVEDDMDNIDLTEIDLPTEVDRLRKVRENYAPLLNSEFSREEACVRQLEEEQGQLESENWYREYIPGWISFWDHVWGTTVND